MFGKRILIVGAWYLAMGVFLWVAIPVLIAGVMLPRRPRLTMVKGGKK